MKIYLFKIFIAIVFLLISDLSVAFEHGNSAWLYGKDEKWIIQIKDFNNNAVFDNKLKYLFPETGVVHIDSNNNKLIMTYDKSVTAFYKKHLGNLKIIPDLSFWVSKTSFKEWTDLQYQVAAKQIADNINDDPNADGVFLDLESYTKKLLPFYKTLINELKLKDKIFSVIIRPGQEDEEWFKTLGDNSFVVLYGYDLHHPDDPSLPVAPSLYKQRLKIAVNHLVEIARITKTPIMGGLPVIATTYEWEGKLTDENKIVHGEYKQSDYCENALEIYNNTNYPDYLGYSIWAFISNANKQQHRYLPYIISKDSWKILINNKTKCN